jgi:hypothetical protein
VAAGRSGGPGGRRSCRVGDAGWRPHQAGIDQRPVHADAQPAPPQRSRIRGGGPCWPSTASPADVVALPARRIAVPAGTRHAAPKPSPAGRTSPASRTAATSPISASTTPYPSPAPYAPTPRQTADTTHPTYSNTNTDRDRQPIPAPPASRRSYALPTLELALSHRNRSTRLRRRPTRRTDVRCQEPLGVGVNYHWPSRGDSEADEQSQCQLSLDVTPRTLKTARPQVTGGSVSTQDRL